MHSGDLWLSKNKPKDGFTGCFASAETRAYLRPKFSGSKHCWWCRSGDWITYRSKYYLCISREVMLRCGITQAHLDDVQLRTAHEGNLIFWQAVEEVTQDIRIGLSILCPVTF